ncbi:hypothetical protein GCM10022627_35000 [Haloarcula argentinensis]|uniref:Uncharacterized protein n=1 Tax=Haloarcula argentinensis TaxID=43776 RepID=A0A830FRD2_HALAR|nr:hypothetical protein GCM10009006_33830 [Haloarcula argentinensis]
MELYNVTESNRTYSIEIAPSVGVVGDWEPFHHVSVLAKNKNGEVSCRKHIGDLTKSGDYEPVTFTCNEFPHTITYEIDRDPCSQGTSVSKYVYNPEQDLWQPEKVECESSSWPW